MTLRLQTLVEPGGRLVVVSPHLDDAVFSIGGALADAAEAGIEVVNLTVFAGDPGSSASPGWWDRKAGFQNAGEAARARREEDGRACRAIGAQAHWLPFPDGQYPEDRSLVWAAMGPLLANADLILAPGFPLVHPDHAWVNSAIRDHRKELPAVGLYVEQPYGEAVWFQTRSIPERSAAAGAAAISWRRVRPSPRAWWQKQKAFSAYRSQIRAMARPSMRVPARVALYEAWRGGEGLAIPIGSSEENNHGR
jgi:LmbE family N-acetylglucosaminyl deacetylase